MKRNWLVYASLALVGATAIAAVTSDNLIVNGKSHPVDVKVINGSAYVKLSDVAKALDMVLVKSGAGKYELTPAGGANQIGGLRGKLGETLFDGKWRFTAVSLEKVDSYKMKTDSEPYGASAPYNWNSQTHTITPIPGNVLVVIQCKVSNGVKERRTLWTAISDDRIRTALANDDGTSSPPVAYDFEGAPTQTGFLLPGAQMTFPVIFSVKKDTKISDLIFTLKNNQGDDVGVDVRVDLKEKD